MKATTSESYRQRLVKVVDYMYQHVSGALDVNTLAEVACMSPYHFHRIYRLLAQEPVNATVRRMRLHAAATDLIRTDLSLTEIAKRLSYSSLEAFSRAFGKEFGQSPARYRDEQKLAHQHWQPFIPMLPNHPEENDFAEQNTMFEVEINEYPEIPLVGMAHTGDYMNIGQAFEKVGQYAVAKQFMSEETRFFGIYFDDPHSVPTVQLRSVACVTGKPVDADTSIGVGAHTLPSGKYATLLFKGPYAELERGYDWFFGQWLPESGYEAGDFPPFEEYLNDLKSVPPSELLTRIYLLLT